MSNKNYMGKIDEDATGKSEPDYDDFSSINRDKEEHKKISQNLTEPEWLEGLTGIMNDYLDNRNYDINYIRSFIEKLLSIRGG